MGRQFLLIMVLLTGPFGCDTAPKGGSSSDVGPGADTAHPAVCPDIPVKGCCNGQYLLWCKSGISQEIDCGNPLSCGWNPQIGEYDCGTDGHPDPSGVFPQQCPGTAPRGKDILLETDAVAPTEDVVLDDVSSSDSGSDCVSACAGKECGQVGGCSCGVCGDGMICDELQQCIPGGGGDDILASDGLPDDFVGPDADIVDPGAGSGCMLCSSDGDCDAGMHCHPLGGGTFCFADCENTDECDTGWMCYQLGNEGKQCIPMAFQCEPECLLNGCPDGQVCNQETGACQEAVGECGTCQQDWDCADGYRCYGNGNYCAPVCGDGVCPANGICEQVNTIPMHLCVSQSVVCCFGDACSGDTCPAETPFPKDGGCVECLEDAHCGTGGTCNDGACASLGLCPMAVIQCAEGNEVIPQTVLHLYGDQSYAVAGTIAQWHWSVEQPLGSQSVFVPSDTFPNPTFEANVAGTYSFQLTVYNEQNVPSCVPDTFEVVVIPDEAIHVELLWQTPEDPDETDEGPEAGSDLDLHFTHPWAGGPDLDGDGQPDGWFDQPFDCFWFNAHPEWGSFDPSIDDNPGLDRDDTDGAGPEIVNLNIPDDVLYRIGVHYWNDHGYGASVATVRVYIYSQLVFEVSDVTLEEKDMWEVCTIDWPSGAVQLVTNQSGEHKITPNYQNPFFFGN